ncbi:hypothetical protein F6X40_35480 [Paraburkholderia sp. UCT31]|uniref:hypothetical protein n=1 Tax=Paraburkholderia sp. UCT31 TaxID=2615209 RepID=UPI001655A36F|nr:hypothetical protein [Paraburkholderia sp. UCT31]MBC8741852.1 hypothetical protein [Paraburkholderia sp. UCT31]
MVVIPKNDGPYTVYDRNGNVSVYRTKAQVVKASGGYGRLKRRLERGKPVCARAWLAQPEASTVWYYAEERASRLVLNTVGDSLAIEAFAEFAPVKKPRIQGDYGVSHEGRKRTNGRWYRTIGTFPERRMNALVLFEDGETASRAARQGKNLPSPWDDYVRSNERNWKVQRQKQYRVR